MEPLKKGIKKSETAVMFRIFHRRILLFIIAKPSTLCIKQCTI